MRRVNMKYAIQCCVFLSFSVFVLCDVEEKTENVAEKKLEKEPEIIEISSDTFKKVMWKKCSNNSYIICAKLALIHVIEKLDSPESYVLLPGISLLKRNDIRESDLEDVIVRKDFNEALDKYLLKKIKRYFGSLTLNVKLLDKNTIDDMRSFSNLFTESTDVETGRGKKKYMHSLLMVGWMSGATLLALTMKTIAILSGKALLAALLSLMLSVISAFSHKGHPETKSTTYEIITKPIVSHSHTADIHDAHSSELNPAFSYKRSINPELIVKDPEIPSDIEHIIRKIKDRTPHYAAVPIEYSKS